MMWEFITDHPWWSLVYLLVICLTSIFWAIGLGAMIGGRRKVYWEEYKSNHAKDKKDVVH